MKCSKIINKIKKRVSEIFYITIIVFNFFLFYNVQKIIFIKKNQPNTIKNSIRGLFTGIENKKSELICERASNDLFILYGQESYDNITTNNISIKSSTSYLYKYLDNKDSSDLKKYIFSFQFEISLVIFIVLIIVIWIVLCCFLSKEKFCCLFNNKKNNQWLKNIIWVISVSFYFIIILLIFLILFYFYPFIQIITNSFCSLFKITYHTYFGEDKNYEILPKWIGIIEIKNLLLNTRDQIEDIIEKNNDIYNIVIHDIKNDFYNELNNDQLFTNNINKFCDLSKFKVPNPNPLSNKTISNLYFCANILNIIQEEFNKTIKKFIIDIDNIYEKIKIIEENKNDIKFSLDNARNKIDSFVKIISDLEIEYFDILYFILEEIISKYFIYGFYIFFIFVLLIEFIGLISIFTNICCCNSKYCYKLYIFILNAQMILLIIIILITISFSVSSVIIKDISIIIQHTISNQNSENTTFSFSKSLYDIEGINICLKGAGNLENYTQLNGVSQSLIHFYSMFKIINDNLNYLLNNKIFVEKNETKLIFEEIENKPYLTQYQLENNNLNNYFNINTYITPEDILENVLNNYTNDENKQIIGNNKYYSNYFFVHSKEFCLNDYNFITKGNDNTYYQNGKYCMLLEDFPENNYFKGITIHNLKENQNDLNVFNYTIKLDNLTKEFKNRYYDKDKGFKSLLQKVVNNSKEYFNEEIEPKSLNIKNSMIKIFQIINSKIKIIDNLYENIIGKNNTNLFSAFNCKYLRRDINIFLNQIDDNLPHSFFILSIYSLFIGIFSLICIITSAIALKLNKMINNYNDYSFATKNKNVISDNDNNISEKPKIDQIREKNIYDDNLKSSINEKTVFHKKKKKGKNNKKPNEKIGE